jgi:glycosyltransferase involved in cell wall biosynthesis
VRVALVYDRINKLGGAELVLQAFHELYPDADWYTSVWDPKKAPFSASWPVHASWLNKIPWLRHHHELVPFLMPFIFESFDLSEYDLVISISSAECKGVVTRANTLHINYCLTPTRYLWSHRETYLSRPQFGLVQKIATPIIKKILDYLASWDLVASTRPDHMISISEHVKHRVQKYYNRDTAVIYPPVDLTKFASIPRGPSPRLLSDYYLTVTRLVPYKNIELLVKTFANSDRKLIIIGTGSEMSKLKKIATSNIQFTGLISSSELRSYYHNCQAFLQANTEDFGISMVEALSVGKPVIAYAKGGAGEIVKDGVNGILVKTDSVRAFRRALDRFETMNLTSKSCIASAKRFGKLEWQKKITSYIKDAYEKLKKQ